jgi:tripartite ATP-independent transporter DctP family solute receptor
MSSLKKLAFALGLCVAATALVAQEAKPKVLRLGYGLQEQSNQVRGARMFAEEVVRLSGGRLQIRTGGNGAFGGDVKMQDALISGELEMMVGSTATLVPIVKEMALWDTPFLVNNPREADALLDGPVGQRVIAKMPEKGLIGLAYWENGFRNLTNNARPITRMEDLTGVKLRVMQNNVFLESFKTLGAQPVPLSFNDLFAAMSSQAVDGQENPFNTILSSKFYEVQKYLSITNHVYSPWILMVSKKHWDHLSGAEREVLTKAARASQQFERNDTRQEAAKALAELAAKGMKVNELSFAESSRMRNRLTRVYATIGANVGMDLMIETQNQLMQLRSTKTAEKPAAAVAPAAPAARPAVRPAAAKT